MKKITALILTTALMLLCLSACDAADSKEPPPVTYPLVYYLPHYQTNFDDRWVSVRFSTLEELSEARRLLEENGVEISDEKRVAFDYRSETYVVKYWFDGILTRESAKLTAERDYYELEYDSATLECYIYFNAATNEDLPIKRNIIRGPHISTYPHDMFGYAHSRITVAPGAVLPENIDTDKLVLEILGPSDQIYGNLHKVTYEGQEIIHIVSSVIWTQELFDEIKHTLVIY